MKRIEYTLAIAAAIILTILWVGNRNVEGAAPLKGYGGRLSTQSMAVMSELYHDLERCRRIQTAGHDQIVLEGPDGTVDYRFAYGALWKNDEVVIPQVKAFHFEYRGPTAHCVSAESNHAAIESVGFAIRLVEKDQEVAAFAKVRVNAVRDDGPVQFASVSR